jgi:hypothetical protein
MAHPPALVWELIKNNNSAIVKRRHQQIWFSTESGNLRNKHSYTQSGFVNRAITVTDSADKKSVVVTAQTGVLRRPAKSTSTITLKRHFRAGAKAVSATAKAVRPELRAAALARYSRIKKSHKLVGVEKKKAKLTRKQKRAAARKTA